LTLGVLGAALARVALDLGEGEAVGMINGFSEAKKNAPQRMFRSV
jgi:hypothetical protein